MFKKKNKTIKRKRITSRIVKKIDNFTIYCNNFTNLGKPKTYQLLLKSNTDTALNVQLTDTKCNSHQIGIFMCYRALQIKNKEDTKGMITFRRLEALLNQV